jgi:lipoprotein-anchoring transpeptidase ErfK/SrfK
MLCVRAAARGRFYCVAIVSVPLVIAATSQAEAAPYYYWNDSQPTISPSERPAMLPRKPKARHTQKPAPLEKEAAKPQGPVMVAVSINKQQVKIYDANGLFAEAPVSTGMKGHSTPMGVFSVIQKQKFHRSNIYSGAPMPFMQRITWSGVALHAGVLPGYPASHGCIRMPPSFATRIYGWTRMGSRILVTPGEVAPARFSHPLLAALKPPQPSASVLPDANAPAAIKSDKGAAVSTAITVATTDLRTTIGHREGAGSDKDETLSSSRSQMRTADASNTNGTTPIVSDVSPGSGPIRAEGAEPRTGAADLKPSVAATEGKAEDTTAGTPTAAKPAEQDESKSAAGQPADTAQAPTPAPSAETPAKLEAAGSTDGKAAAPKIADQPAAPSNTAADAPTKPDEAKDSKDQSRLAAPVQPVAPKPELKRNSQIAIFISRKDSKLYVRQNFAPVFNTPIAIAPSEKPLGTHVFTAAADKADPTTMTWTVVSLAASPRSDASEHAARRGKTSAETRSDAKPAPQVSSAAEALDRISIPADVVAWLGEALSSGSSLIVSDQGINQGETGEGTEFILSLR